VVGEPLDELVAVESLSDADGHDQVGEQAAVGGGLHEGLDGRDDELRAAPLAGTVASLGEIEEQFQALGCQLMRQIGLSRQDFEGGIHAGIAAGAEELQLIEDIVGFVEVGGDQEEGAVEALLRDGREDDRAGSPLAGRGDVAVFAEAAA
jgi:hypothetical protein